MKAEFTRHLVETELGTVHALMRSGDRARRPLVMLHMSPRSSRMYMPYMALAARTVVAVDRPGFGASDVPPFPPAIRDYAVSTLDTLDALGIETFDVVGTHTGSVEAVELANLAPQRVGTVVAVSLPAYKEDEAAERRLGVGAPRSRPVARGSHLVDMWRRRARLRTPPLDLDHLRDLFVDELISMPTVHWAYRAVLDYPLLERIGSVGSLVVLAPHDDLWPLTNRARSKLAAGVSFVELPDLDFDLWERAPQRMAEIIERELGPASSAPSCDKPVEPGRQDC